MRTNYWLLIGALSGLTSVAAGAFGAHGLRARLSPDLLAVFETGARYQMYHAIVLVLVGVLAAKAQTTALTVSGALLLAGTVLFSGSLYVLALSGVRWLGAITPLGGLCFMGGWAALAYAALHALRD